MPRFEKGSDEAKEYMKLLRSKRKINGNGINIKPNTYSSSQKEKIKNEVMDISYEDAKKSFEDLSSINCNELKKIPPLSRIGNDAVNYFTLKERLDTKGKKKISYFDLLYNKNQYENKEYIKRLIEKGGETNKYKIWNSIMGVYFGLPSIFKPLLSMEYYCRFNPSSVLDFTMGWGGRLIGACALDIPNYIGIDLNKNLEKPYKEMVNMIKPYTDTNITLYFKDALKIDYSKLNYDMVLTSPPYYNIEIYKGTKRQSKEDWNEKFYKPIFIKTYNGMKKGGHYCLNVPIEVYENVCIKVLGKADIIIPLTKNIRQKGGGENYKEFTYVWKKK